MKKLLIKRISDHKENLAFLAVITILIAVFFLITNEKKPTLSNNSKTGVDIVDEDTCFEENYSNNAWIQCEQDLLEKTKLKKKEHFEKLLDLFKTNKQNIVLRYDNDSNKDFMDWYNSSDKNNRIACIAEEYYQKAGSGYEGGLAICITNKTLADIKTIDNLYSNLLK